MTSQPTRKTLRFSLSTAIVMMLTASVFVGLNFRPTERYIQGDGELGVYDIYHETKYGSPYTFYKKIEWKGDAGSQDELRKTGIVRPDPKWSHDSDPKLIDSHVSYVGFIDFIAALCCVILSAFISEFFIRRRASTANPELL